MHVIRVDRRSNLRSKRFREVFCFPYFECAQFPRGQTAINAQKELYAAQATYEVVKTAIVYKATERKLYLIH